MQKQQRDLSALTLSGVPRRPSLSVWTFCLRRRSLSAWTFCLAPIWSNAAWSSLPLTSSSANAASVLAASGAKTCSNHSEGIGDGSGLGQCVVGMLSGIVSCKVAGWSLGVWVLQRSHLQDDQTAVLISDRRRTSMPLSDKPLCACLREHNQLHCLLLHTTRLETHLFPTLSSLLCLAISLL